MRDEYRDSVNLTLESGYSVGSYPYLIALTEPIHII